MPCVETIGKIRRRRPIHQGLEAEHKLPAREQRTAQRLYEALRIEPPHQATRGNLDWSVTFWIVVFAVTTQIALTAEGAEILKHKQSSGIR